MGTCDNNAADHGAYQLQTLHHNYFGHGNFFWGIVNTHGVSETAIYSSLHEYGYCYTGWLKKATLHLLGQKYIFRGEHIYSYGIKYLI
jgi:hypothetical protein